jgi:hypothetical protein
MAIQIVSNFFLSDRNVVASGLKDDSGKNDKLAGL